MNKARRNLAELESLKDERFDKLGCKSGSPPAICTTDTSITELNSAIQANIREIAGLVGASSSQTDGSKTEKILNELISLNDKRLKELKCNDDANKATCASDKTLNELEKSISQKIQQTAELQQLAGVTTPSIHCPDDAPVRRGFQILGPEGWRTFDQDERLILAMSSDSKPLISTLTELSNRVLNAQARPEAILLPLAEERLKLSDADRTLREQMVAERTEDKPDGDPKAIANAVCKTLMQDVTDNNICPEEKK